jgi:hypothetical protein
MAINGTIAPIIVDIILTATPAPITSSTTASSYKKIAKIVLIEK